MSQQIEIYQGEDGQTDVRVRFGQETLWLTQAQLATLLDTTTDNISLHLKNIYEEGELSEQATTEDYSVVRQEGKRQVKRQLKHYNLDAIISVGYRVNSKKGTQFRIWATQRLKDYLVQGYAINQQRFDSNSEELQQAIALIQKTAKSPELTAEAGSGLVDIVSCYTQTFLWLQRYVDFLHRNGRLLDASDNPVINDTGLAALTLLIAESDPKQKETLVRLVMHMLANAQ